MMLFCERLNRILILGEVITHRTPQKIMDEIAALDSESAEVLARIRTLLKQWQEKEHKR